jgi:hypothetical protein
MLHAVAFALALVCAGCAFHSEPWPELGPELERDRSRLLDAGGAAQGDDDAGELEQLDAAALDAGELEQLDAAALDAGELEQLDAAALDAGELEQLDAGGAAGAAAAAGSSSSAGMGGGAAGAAAGAGAGGMGGGAGGAGECWAGPWPCVRGSSPDCVCTQ